MKNLSIRTKILAGIVIVNLLGALTVAVYLHESYSGSLDVHAQDTVSQGAATWNEIAALGNDELGSPLTPGNAQKYVATLKNITGAEYGILVDKQALDQAEYEAALEAEGKPSNWDERGTYVLMAVSDEAVAEKMQLEATPDAVPEMGKLVGIENGACSRTCHGGIEGEGDFWTVAWSSDSVSRAHTVFPIYVDNQPVGIAYSVEDISVAADSAKQSVLSTLLVIIVGLLIATVLIAIMLDRLVVKRLNRMIASMEDISVRVAGGDFDAHFIADGTSDEIGRFEEFFARFMDLVSGTLKSLVK